MKFFNISNPRSLRSSNEEPNFEDIYGRENLSNSVSTNPTSPRNHHFNENRKNEVHTNLWDVYDGQKDGFASEGSPLNRIGTPKGNKIIDNSAVVGDISVIFATHESDGSSIQYSDNVARRFKFTSGESPLSSGPSDKGTTNTKEKKSYSRQSTPSSLQTPANSPSSKADIIGRYGQLALTPHGNSLVGDLTGSPNPESQVHSNIADEKQDTAVTQFVGESNRI